MVECAIWLAGVLAAWVNAEEMRCGYMAFAGYKGGTLGSFSWCLYFYRAANPDLVSALLAKIVVVTDAFPI